MSYFECFSVTLPKSDESTFFCLSLLNLVQVKQIIKVKQISTHQTLITRKTVRFPRIFLSQNMTHRIRVVKKYQDSYHCGRWLHHHNSRGFHVRFYSVKQSLTPTTYFFMFQKLLLLKRQEPFLRHWLQNETGLHTFKLLLLLRKANLHEMYSHTTGT